MGFLLPQRLPLLSGIWGFPSQVVPGGDVGESIPAGLEWRLGKNGDVEWEQVESIVQAQPSRGERTPPHQAVDIWRLCYVQSNYFCFRGVLGINAPPAPPPHSLVWIKILLQSCKIKAVVSLLSQSI